jgi:hypothetical protein
MNGPRERHVEHKLKLSCSLGVTKVITILAMNRVTLLSCCLSQTSTLMFNKPASEANSMNKKSCIAVAQGVTEFGTITHMT